MFSGMQAAIFPYYGPYWWNQSSLMEQSIVTFLSDIACRAAIQKITELSVAQLRQTRIIERN